MDRNELSTKILFLTDLQHKPLDEEFTGEVAESVNTVISYLQEQNGN